MNYIKNLFTDFKNFAVKGNMVDMAVGIILGAAFNGVVNSIVADLIMPPISLLLAKINLSGLFFTLKDGAGQKVTFVTKNTDGTYTTRSQIYGATEITVADTDVAGPYASIEAAKEAGAVVLNLGAFIKTAISFIITAWAVFMLVKFISKLKKQPAPVEAVPTTKECPFCKSIININATKCPHCTSELK